MSDAETVPEWLVPYIEALRNRLYACRTKVYAENVETAARALVDAVERPTAGEPPSGMVQVAPHDHPEGWNCNCVGIYAPAPADPVSEPVRHNHMTRDVKAPGKCPRCDEQRERLTAPTTPRDELADAEDTPISADALRDAVLKWASRFEPGDRWDTEDAHDLEVALGGTVENRCHHRDVDTATPRVARSLDDLRVGQVVVYHYSEGGWGTPFTIQNHARLGMTHDFHDKEGEVVILSDPPAPAATPPTTTADLPTTPGSVIEAKGASGVPRLWFHRDEPRYWINDNGTIAGDSALTLVRVVFDAGRDHA